MSSRPDTAADAERRAWGWVAALRAGETTPWQSWTGTADRTGRYLPGAQQLELLRRINLAGPPLPTLADRVLAASAPGRGSPDLELVGAQGDAEPPRWGPRPVDPVDLPDSELVRVATGLLAEDVVAHGTPPPPTPRRGPWRPRSYRVVGDPWWADAAREELVRQGRPPGGRRPTVLVLGRDFATMVADAYTAGAFGAGVAPWIEWLGSPRRRTPPRADLHAAAHSWAGRVGPDRLRIVLDPQLLARAVGTRRALPEPPRLAADAVHLAARVAAPLGLLVLPEERRRLLRGGLLPRLLDCPGAPLTLPASHHRWAVRRAERMRAAIRDAGYPVLGDLDTLLPRLDPVPGTAAGQGPAPDDEAGVLALAVRLLREGAAP